MPRSRRRSRCCSASGAKSDAHWLGGDNRFWLTAAAGPGLTPGYGSPEARVVVSLDWTNRPVPRPPEPWPPPPPPPEPPEAAARPRRRSPTATRTASPTTTTSAPTSPRTRTASRTSDGCPDPDNDKDGIPDAADKCPNEPETINGIEDDDGCPDKGETAVHIGKEELETLKPIFFETDHSRVRHAYYNILGQIALTLKAHPEIGRCAVEGHTDDTGPPEWNQKLSLLRAEAVVEFLVDKGVERSRLTAIGRGEKLPWAPNDTEEGRAQNRRVIFHIEGVNADEQKREERRQLMRARKAGASVGGAPAERRRDARDARGHAPQRRPRRRREDAVPAWRRQRLRCRREGGTKAGTKTGAEDHLDQDHAPHAPGASRPRRRRRPSSSNRRQPATKKPAPRPDNPSPPKTLRDLLRLPER